ncbi:MAG: ATP-grasp domain-containing protein [Pirellulales bacterium]|nr:ATP-grasp domain-containing protein [Pirellulales bacterium]
MTQVFLFEHLTGGGLLEESAPAESLLREGSAMIRAVTEDFVKAKCSVDVLLDARLQNVLATPVLENARSGGNLTLHSVSGPTARDRKFAALASAADWSLVIAPETNGTLSKLNQSVRDCDGRLLGVSNELCTLATSKTATSEFLTQHGLPSPRGMQLTLGQRKRDTVNTDAVGWRHTESVSLFPAILKPDDGCGSVGVRRIARPELLAGIECTDELNATSQWRLEEEILGTLVSVSVVLGEVEETILPPCRQHLGGRRGFEFQYSSIIAEDALAARAKEMAERTVTALRALGENSPSIGWLGIDMILAEQTLHDMPGVAGSHVRSRDVILEVNPRVTSSYVWLRCQDHMTLPAGNLAEAMLQSATQACAFPAER